jgi:hypothetical protein
VECTEGQVLVHYEGYHQQYDEWISTDCTRLLTDGAEPTAGVMSSPRASPAAASVVEPEPAPGPGPKAQAKAKAARAPAPAPAPQVVLFSDDDSDDSDDAI